MSEQRNLSGVPVGREEAGLGSGWIIFLEMMKRFHDYVNKCLLLFPLVNAFLSFFNKQNWLPKLEFMFAKENKY